MFELLFTPQNFAFGVALSLMLFLFVLEVVGLLFGGVNDWVDGLLPDNLVEHPEIGIDTVDAGIVVRFLSWLYVGRIPLLMVIVVFLAVFSLLGFLMQSLIFGVAGFYLPSLVACVAVWILSLPVVKACNGLLYKVLPKDETTAICLDELIGRVGVVTLGVATHDKPTQIKVKDTHGQTHYVMAYADDVNSTLSQGQSVLLVSKEGAYFRAIVNTNAVLMD